MNGKPHNPENRLLVLALTAKDAELSSAIFGRAGISCRTCPNLEDLCEEMDHGVAAILLPEEAIVHERHICLADKLEQQPAWSDLPVLILAQEGADSVTITRAMEILGNVTVLERPARVASLISTIRAALRARQRQYQIREHLREREETEERLIENDRRKDEFLAILAHELRNPLAPIVNSLQVLRLTSKDENVLQIAEMVDRQVGHMVRLVDDLLEVSRITRGKIELRKELVELGDVLRTAIESCRPVIDSAGHELIDSIPSSSMILDADPVRMSQVFSNLLNNACKYTDPGGRISVSVTAEDKFAIVSIRDTGMGIPQEMLVRVFDLFTQLEHGSRAQGGLGIGLTLVKQLVEMHGGSVSASSEGIGHGSEFVVRMPLVAQAAGRIPLSAMDKPATTLSRCRVLVVDDNRDAADSLSTLLSLLGARVKVAYSGPEALAVLETFSPSYMLLDIGMPGMDGHEVARRVRQQHKLEDVTLIAMTGWGQEEDRRRTKAAGFDHHLTKPADLDALSALLFPAEVPHAVMASVLDDPPVRHHS